MLPSGAENPAILWWVIAFVATAALSILVLERVAGRRDPELWRKFGVQLLLVASILVPARLGGVWLDALCVLLLAAGARELVALRGAPKPALDVLLACAMLVLGVLSLRHVGQRSFAQCFFLYATVELNDSFANIVGRHVGRHPLAPRLSPRKTWEGAIAGVVAGATAGALLSPFLGAGADRVEGAALGALLAVCAVMGDLAASALKRRHGIKDFAHTLPNHGGVLDAFDTLLLVAPIFAVLR